MKFNSLFRKLVIPTAGILVTMPMMVGATEVTFAQTNGNSAGDAVEWVRSYEGQGLDYDGSYGNQCVDLIKAYYDFLGETPMRGNADTYAYNALPDGWERIQNADPQPGDILVYTGGSYGHVAICTGENESYHQNWGGSYVQRVTGDCYSTGNGYWGVIRPDFEEADASSEDVQEDYSEEVPDDTGEGYSYEDEGSYEDTHEYSYSDDHTFSDRGPSPHRMYVFDYGFRPEGARGEKPLR